MAYKCRSPTIREVILKVIGSEKESTASQIEFLQSVDFDSEDWLIAMHDAEVISLIRKLFSHGAQFRYRLYTRWATKTQGDITEPFVTWPLIRSESAQVAADEREAAKEAACETACEKSARAERDALDAHLRHSPLALLPMRDGKCRFDEVDDDDSAQLSSSLTNSHNTSPVARFSPDPRQPPLTYRPQSINTPTWNGKAETYDAWKAGLIPALAQLGYSDLLVTGDPHDPAVKAYV